VRTDAWNPRSNEGSGGEPGRSCRVRIHCRREIYLAGGRPLARSNWVKIRVMRDNMLRGLDSLFDSRRAPRLLARSCLPANAWHPRIPATELLNQSVLRTMCGAQAVRDSASPSMCRRLLRSRHWHCVWFAVLARPRHRAARLWQYPMAGAPTLANRGDSRIFFRHDLLGEGKIP
jgi:hypothetical protein